MNRIHPEIFANTKIKLVLEGDDLSLSLKFNLKTPASACYGAVMKGEYYWGLV